MILEYQCQLNKAPIIWTSKMKRLLCSILVFLISFGVAETYAECLQDIISETPEDSETPLLFGIYYANVSVTICSASILEQRSPIQLDNYADIFWIKPNEKRTKIYANSFSHLPNIRVLNASNIQLTKLEPSAFKGLQKLQYLNLEKNLLELLPPDLFEDTPDLVRLYLRNNKLKSISENQFENLTNLQKLDLSGNQLQDLPDGWDRSLQKVLRLFLHSNNFTVIRSRMFQRMRSLTLLSLDHNKITTVEPNAFEGLIYLEFVGLDSNRDMISDNFLNELKSLESLNSVALSPQNFECSSWAEITKWADKMRIQVIQTLDSCRDVRFVAAI